MSHTKLNCVVAELSDRHSLSAENSNSREEEEEEGTDTAKYQLTETDTHEDRSVNNHHAGNYQLISVDDKITATSSITITSSTPTDSSDSDINSDEDEIRKSDQIPLHVSQPDTDDSLSKRLISEESSNHRHVQEEEEQPVTTDLTLTKTVEPTEYDPDPEPEAIPRPSEVIGDVKLQQEVDEKNVEPVERERIVEEAIDIKEMSHNFESTMDDISDAELESLEQELDDLIASAAAEGTLEKIASSDTTSVSKIEESIEKTLEIEEKIIDVNEPSQQPSEDMQEEETEKVDKLEMNSEQEVSAKIEELDETKQDDQQESEVSEAQEATEPEPNFQPAASEIADNDPVLSTSSTDESASIQNLPSQSNEDFSVNESNSTGSLTSQPDLGKVPPYWIPDNMTNQCMQCDQKFSLIKRRHHCRACGLLLCSACCSEKFFLTYLQGEGRICGPCHEILLKAQQNQQQLPKHPNPSNPSEYCSTLPVQQQIDPATSQPLTVMVPRSGVLKRSSGTRASERKSVIFSDGIRPGTDLDDAFDTSTSRVPQAHEKTKSNLPALNEKNNSFIPEQPNELPPILIKESEYKYVDNNLMLLQRLRQEELKFAINKNFYVTVKIVTCE